MISSIPGGSRISTACRRWAPGAVLFAIACISAQGAGLTVTCTPPALVPEATFPYSVSCTAAAVAPAAPSGTYTWTLPAGATGASTTANITVTVTPAAAGPVPVTVSVADAADGTINGSGSANIPNAVAALAIGCNPPVGTLETGATYSVGCASTGGVSQNWSLVGSFAGLSVSSTGQVSGAFTGSGNQTFQVQVSDAYVTRLSGALGGVLVPPPSLSCTPVAPLQVGIHFFSNCTVTNGTASFTPSVTPGLPAGLSLNSTNGASFTNFAISGTPTALAPAFSVKVTDSASGGGVQSGSVSFAATTGLTPNCTAPQGEVGVALTVSCSPSGGAGPYRLSLSSAPGFAPVAGPAGPTATASATPTQAGSFSLVATVTDSSVPALSMSQPLTVTIAPALVLTCATTTAPSEIGVLYTNTCTATGGTGSYSMSSSGTPPSGITASISPGAVTFSGTPTPGAAPGVYNFAAQVNDTLATQSVSISTTLAARPSINCVLPSVTLEVGVMLSFPCTGSGGIVPPGTTYTWAVSGLPSGLSLSSSSGASVTISGVPAGSGPSTFTVSMSDSIGQAAPASPQTITVVPLPMVTCNNSAGPVEVNINYSNACSVLNGVAPYSWSISSGTVPAGITTSGQGAPGTSYTFGSAPAAGGAGNYSYTLTVTDGNGKTYPVTYTGNVAPPPVLTCTPTVGPTQVNVAYSTICSVSGGSAASFTFSVNDPMHMNMPIPLPMGLLASSSARAVIISGTPTMAGSYSYNVTATEQVLGVPVPSTQLFSGTINSAISLTCTAPAVVGHPDVVAIIESGAVMTQGCEVVGGSGTIDITTTSDPSLIVATPGRVMAGPGKVPFTVTYTVRQSPGTPVVSQVDISVDDSSATRQHGQIGLKVTIQPLPTLSCSPFTGPIQVGLPYTANCEVHDGIGPFLWSAPSGLLPGLTLTNGGNRATVTGAVTSSSDSYSYGIRVEDLIVTGAGAPTQTFTGKVLPAVTFTCDDTRGPVEVSLAYRTTCTVSGGLPPYKFDSVNLPAGFKSDIQADKIIVSGTSNGTFPPSAVAFNYTLTASDSNNPPQTVSNVFTGTIQQVPVVTCSIPSPVTDRTGTRYRLSGSVGSDLSVSCNAAYGLVGRTAPYYKWQIGNVPEGLVRSDDDTGSGITLTGLPIAGKRDLTVRAIDSRGVLSAPVTIAITVQARLTVSSQIVGPNTGGTCPPIERNNPANLQSLDPGKLCFQVTNASAERRTEPITVTVTPPSGLTLLPELTGGPNSNWSCTPADKNDVSCKLNDAQDSLDSGSSTGYFELPFRVAPDLCIPANALSYSVAVQLGSQPIDDRRTVPFDVTGCVLLSKKTVAPFKISAGDEPGGAYEVTVRNATAVAGSPGVTLSKIQVRESLSKLLQVNASDLVSADGWSCQVTNDPNTGQSVVCSYNGTPLQPGEVSKSILIPVSVHTTKCFVPERASVSLDPFATPQDSATGGTSVPGSGCLAVTSVYGQADVFSPFIGAGGTAPRVRPHDSASGANLFSVLVSNTSEGTYDLNGRLVFTAPTGLAAARRDSSPEWDCSQVDAASPITCRLSSLAGGGSSLLQFELLNADQLSCGLYNGQIDVESGTDHKTYTVPATVGKGCITLARAPLGLAGQSGNAGPNDIAAYALKVGGGNTAPDGTAVTVHESLPAGVVLSAPVTGDGWNCEASAGQTVTCTRADHAGSYPDISVTVKLSTDACPGFLATAYAGAGTTDQAAASQLVQLTNCWAIKHEVSSLNLRAPSSYLITPTYLGTGDNPLIGQITVREDLPDGITVQQASGDDSSWACTTSQTGAICRHAAAPGAYVPVRVVAQATAAACKTPGDRNPGARTNARLTANTVDEAVAAALGFVDSPECPQAAITAKSDLRILNGSYLTPGRSALYTITVANAGPGAIDEGQSTGFSVTFPVGITPGKPGADQAPGWTCDTSGQTVNCVQKSGLGFPGEFAPIPLTLKIDQAACLQNRTVAWIGVLAGKKVLDDRAPNPIAVNGCINVSPNSLRFDRRTIGTPGAPQSVVLTSLDDSLNMRVDFAPPAKTSDFKVTADGCPDGTKACSLVLKPKTARPLNVTYDPRCIGNASETLNYSISLVDDSGKPLDSFSQSESVSLTGQATLLGIAFSLSGGATPIDATTFRLSPASAYDVKVTTTPASACVSGIKPDTSLRYVSFTDAKNNPAKYDAGVADQRTCTDCAGTLKSGTVAGDVKVEVVFKDGDRVLNSDTSQIGVDTTLTGRIPLLAPHFDSLSKGTQAAASFVLKLAGYSTPRENTLACFTFKPAVGTILDTSALAALNGCALKGEIASAYDSSSRASLGSQFAVDATFPYNGDFTALGTVEVWLKNDVGTSDHMCLDFKSGSTKAGACQ